MRSKHVTNYVGSVYPLAPSKRKYGLVYGIKYYVYITLCTGCAGRNLLYLGRIFLRLTYIDITKNNHVH